MEGQVLLLEGKLQQALQETRAMAVKASDAQAERQAAAWMVVASLERIRSRPHRSWLLTRWRARVPREAMSAEAARAARDARCS